MGITTISAVITNLSGRKKASGKFLVDTGATYTVVPHRMNKTLRLKPDRVQKFTLADGTVVKRELGYAMVKIDGRKTPSPVVIGEKGDSALIGSLTLEGMGLMVDPFKRKLLPMKLMLG